MVNNVLPPPFSKEPHWYQSFSKCLDLPLCLQLYYLRNCITVKQEIFALSFFSGFNTTYAHFKFTILAQIVTLCFLYSRQLIFHVTCLSTKIVKIELSQKFRSLQYLYKALETNFYFFPVLIFDKCLTIPEQNSKKWNNLCM